jgi:hypothetical protein
VSRFGLQNVETLRTSISTTSNDLGLRRWALGPTSTTGGLRLPARGLAAACGCAALGHLWLGRRTDAACASGTGPLVAATDAAVRHWATCGWDDGRMRLCGTGPLVAGTDAAVRHWATCGWDDGRMRLVPAGVPQSVHSYLRLEEDEGQIEAVARRREVVEQAAALGAGGRAGAALSSMGCAPVGSRSKGSPASGRPARSSIRALPA